MAIAFDASSNGRGSGVTSQTVAHTCTGSDRCLVVNVVVDTPDTCTGVTYNSVSMTQAAKVLAGGSRYIYTYTLLAPATGANNIVASRSTAGFLEVNAASYTGVSQTGQPEASVTNAGNVGLATLTTTVTTLTDNAWAVMSVLGSSGTLAAGAGTTKRVSNLVGGIFDSGAAITPAAAAPLIFTSAASEKGAISVSLAPSTGGLTLTPSLFTNTNTFYSPTVAPGAVSLTPSLFTNSNTFYSATVSLAGGAQTLTAGLFSNSNAFYGPTVVRTPGFLTPAMKNNTGAVWANETGITCNVYNQSTGALVLHKTGLTADANGVVSVTDNAMVEGTTYDYNIKLGTAQRLPTAVA